MSKSDKLLNLLFLFFFQLLIMMIEVRMNRGATFWMAYEPLIHNTLLPIRFMTIAAPLAFTLLIGLGGEMAEFIKNQNERDKNALKNHLLNKK